MASITFYPLGNADSSLIEFADGKLMLIDYYRGKDENDDEDKRINLAEELRAVIDQKEREYFDVVAFSHRDKDHVLGADEFFWLEHNDKYQADDRVKIDQLWVPAYYILEEGLTDSAKVIQAEARYRLKEGKGIRVFSNPGKLDEWLRKEKVEPKERAHLIISAGTCVPDFPGAEGHAEIFVHAPFAFKRDEEDIDQNGKSLVLHMTFFEGARESRAFFGADTTHDVWHEIVYKTRQKKRPERLIWDIFKISHHCSYKALSEEKGKEKTEPTENVQWLFEQGEEKCFIISSSKPIPSEETDLPPHKQASAYYREVASEKTGEFLVTMEEPKETKPKPIVIEINKHGLTWAKTFGVAIGSSAVVARASGRQGVS